MRLRSNSHAFPLARVAGPPGRAFPRLPETSKTRRILYVVLRSAGTRPIERIIFRKSSGGTYSPNVAPAALEIFSSINVPLKSFAPALRQARETSNPSFTQETCRFLIAPWSSTRASACTRKCSSRPAPARAPPCLYSRVFSWMKPRGTNSVKPPVRFWIDLNSKMCRTQSAASSTCPYIIVEVLGIPSSCAVVMISTQRATGSLFGLNSCRTRSSKISAAVPGMLPSPSSFIIRR